MNDLIIFLCFVIFMTLSVGFIQAIQIEKLKEKVRYLKKSEDIYYKTYQKGVE
tara:strand:+ start:14072 stop:14230 length:159 start_codon:yes stop_codon:yes gene_type:complete